MVVLVIAVAFAISGYRQGFVVGILSFVGFVGGAVIGAQIGPHAAKAFGGGQAQQDILALTILVAAAVVGQFLTSTIGAAMRSRMTWRPVAFVDAVGGAGVSVLSVLLIAWVVGSVLAASPFPLAVRQINDSAVLRTVDRLMPMPARTTFSDVRRLLASGPFPQVFSGLGAMHILPVPPASSAVLDSPGYLAARSRVVKVMGTAPSCSRDIEGSGFVYAPDHILTNAHVVAGVTEGPDVYTADGTEYRARVVLYDPEVDIAVLDVPGLDMTPLSFAGPAATEDEAVVTGYPLDHPLTGVPARVGGTENATGPDIYQDSQVTRQIYELKAIVQPGNSGGPLLAPDGEVYGVVFAASLTVPDTGYALTAGEVSADARSGAHDTVPVSTQGCA